jgi:hypothetical protein
MIQESPQAGLESKLALNRVMEGNRNRNLTEQDSEKNIADNLVVVAGFDGVNEHLPDGSANMKSKGAGTGLRLTTDGFILTAYHNIQAYEDDWRRIQEENPPTQANIHRWMEDMKSQYVVVDQNRTAYPIDITCWAINPALDIAVIKAVILEKPEPVDFRLVTGDLQVGDEIKLLGLRNQRPYNQYGKVISASRDADINHPETGERQSTTYDTFLTDAYGTPGFSGGVFTSLRGEFAGLALYIQNNGNGQIGHAGGAKASNIVNLVKEFAYELNKLDK